VVLVHYAITEWIFDQASPILNVVEPVPPRKIMRPTTFAQSREIVELVSTYRNGVSLKQFSELVTDRFGHCARFQDGPLIGIDLIDLLVLLEGRDELRVVSGVVFPCAPACVH
jgi:hypothetical protein